MDSLQFKEAKAAWRLILRFCTIETAVAVFQTCRENRELSREESLWNVWCFRDFGKKGERKDYIDRFEFGSHLWFSNGNDKIQLDLYGFPCYMFKERGNFFVTFRKYSVYPVQALRCWSVGDSFYSGKGKYDLDVHGKSIIGLNGKPLESIHLSPLLKWIDQRFDRNAFLYIKNHCMVFDGTPNKEHRIGTRDSTTTLMYTNSVHRRYFVYFDGRMILDGKPGIEVFIINKDDEIENSPRLIK